MNETKEVFSAKEICNCIRRNLSLSGCSGYFEMTYHGHLLYPRIDLRCDRSMYGYNLGVSNFSISRDFRDGNGEAVRLEALKAFNFPPLEDEKSFSVYCRDTALCLLSENCRAEVYAEPLSTLEIKIYVDDRTSPEFLERFNRFLEGVENLQTYREQEDADAIIDVYQFTYKQLYEVRLIRL